MKLLDVEHRYEKGDNDWHQRMTALRDNIRKELGEELRPLRESAGGINKYNQDVSDISETSKEVSKTGGTSRDYITARLKRDAPELADKVINTLCGE